VSFSFNIALTTDRDRVRFILGDTEATDVLLDDETIDANLTTEGSLRTAAIACCRGILAKLAREVSTAVPPLTVQLQQRFEHYQMLLHDLRSRQLVAPYAGGLTVTDKQLREQDTDRVPPDFTRGQFDYPPTTSPPAGSSGATRAPSEWWWP
jgi:hypothetical protein